MSAATSNATSFRRSGADTLLQQRARIAVLERKVRLAAAEVNAAVEGPRRVDEGKSHEATFPVASSRVMVGIASASQLASRLIPDWTGIRGDQPTAASSFDVSET